MASWNEWYRPCTVPLLDVETAIRILEMMRDGGSGLPAACVPRTNSIIRSLKRLHLDIRMHRAHGEHGPHPAFPPGQGPLGLLRQDDPPPPAERPEKPAPRKGRRRGFWSG